MRPRPLVVALLSLTLFAIHACSDSESPSELVTSPGGALRDAVGIAVNDCPFLSAHDSLIVDEDTYKPNIYFAVYDDDEADLHEVIVTQYPSHGFLGVQHEPSEHPTMYYDPGRNWCGSDSVKFKVTDGTCESNEVTVYLQINCVNDCPTAYPETYSVDQGGLLNFKLFASDEEHDTVTYQLVQAPAHGAVVLQNQTGSGTYTPAAGYCGADYFTFVASDGQCLSGQETVHITVNCPPADSDEDGVPDDEDDCDDSNTDATVSIDGCDSGVANPVGEDGCSLADAIGADVAAASATAPNHGKFVSAMAKNLNAMVNSGAITAEQKEALMHCIGSFSYNKAN
jgi:hypothetical protein